MDSKGGFYMVICSRSDLSDYVDQETGKMLISWWEELSDATAENAIDGVGHFKDWFPSFLNFLKNYLNVKRSTVRFFMSNPDWEKEISLDEFFTVSYPVLNGKLVGEGDDATLQGLHVEMRIESSPDLPEGTSFIDFVEQLDHEINDLNM